MGKSQLKRWGPLVGGVTVLVIAGLKASGHGELADAGQGFLQMVGLSDQSPIDSESANTTMVLVVGAAGQIYGIFRKLKSEYEKAKAQELPMGPKE